MCVPPNYIGSVLKKSKGGTGREVWVALLGAAVRGLAEKARGLRACPLLGPPPRWRLGVTLTLF